MNNQKREALQDFLQELIQARVVRKDRKAESMIYQAIAHQPDVPYLLVQRNFLQEQALDAAKHEIAILRNQIEQVRSSGNIRILDAPSGWGNAASRYASDLPDRSGSVGAPYGYASSGRYYPSASRPGLVGSGMGSFLGSMAATAAGVAAGSFLFHGIDELIHDHDYSGNTETTSFGGEDTSRFMEESGQDYGGLAGEAGIDDIGGMDDFS